MKILLIMPHPYRKRHVYERFSYPSLTLQQIAGITPLQHFVEIVDERYKNINFNRDHDLVGITCMTYSSLRAYEIADEFRNRGKTVVLGGYHPSVLPTEAKQHADSVVIGEAEISWPRLLKDFENGELKPYYKAEKLVEPELIPPARHDLGIFNLFNEAIQASRGCPIRCSFCAMQQIEGPKFRARPIENVAREMESIKAKNISFADASLTINPTYTKSLFKKIAPLKKRFHCFGNVNILSKDDEFLQLASKAGVDRWYIGIESITQESIREIRKKTNIVENYSAAIKKIRNYNMSVTGFFMFGFDHDTLDVFDKTLQFMIDLDLDGISFSILQPFPGTQIAERLEKEGRITSRDWSRYDDNALLYDDKKGNVNYKPKNMTAKELYQNVRRICQEYFSYSNIFKRSHSGLITNNILDLNRFFKRLNENILYRKYYLNSKLG